MAYGSSAIAAMDAHPGVASVAAYGLLLLSSLSMADCNDVSVVVGILCVVLRQKTAHA
jgi:hypothetical protein